MGSKADEALDLLKKHKSVTFNDHCEGSAITVSLKKSWVEESIEFKGYYHLHIKVIYPNGNKKDCEIKLDWVKIETESGSEENLAKVMGFKKYYCTFF